MADDESTAGDLGLLAGHGWAERHGHGELAEEARRRVAYGEITDELREMVMNAGGMDDRLALLRPTAWPNDEPAFWQGFISGVRVFVVEDLDQVAKLN